MHVFVPSNRPLRLLAPLAFAFGLLARPEGASARTSADEPLRGYFAARVQEIAERAFAPRSEDDWTSAAPARRRALMGMLGLDPAPARGDLRATITGRIEREDFVVEKIHFQSIPGLYVTANLYLPRSVVPSPASPEASTDPAGGGSTAATDTSGAGADPPVSPPDPTPVPAILYLCGHAKVQIDGVAYGNKVAYQHHPIRFARAGYACLAIDTLQLGEVAGLHHGTHHLGMWDWNSRGYTPAGVETWNAIRALDYLESRPEIDATRLGVTGRSGGGAYTWFVAACDERVKVAAPVAGITDLENHVLDDCIEGHCDCMFPVNWRGWDFPDLAALVAPRPLLIVNTDKDPIFPLDGVMRVFWKVRDVYDLLGAGTSLGVALSEGPHKDVPELQLAAFRWFDRHLMGREIPTAFPAEKIFEPAELKVFAALPADATNARAHEIFAPRAPEPGIPADEAAWNSMRVRLLERLRAESFAAWPSEPPPPDLVQVSVAESDGILLQSYDYDVHPALRLRLYVLRSADTEPEAAVLRVVGEADLPAMEASLGVRFPEAFGKGEPGASSPGSEGVSVAPDWIATHGPSGVGRDALVLVLPRGISPGANASEDPHFRRRFMLLGETMASGRVWDVLRAIEAVRRIPGFEDGPLSLEGGGAAGAVALYAAALSDSVESVAAHAIPATHAAPDAPDLLNVLRFMDVPQLVALAAHRADVSVDGSDPEATRWALELARRLEWPPGRLAVVPIDDRRAP